MAALSPAGRAQAHVAFTAHSIPVSMARNCNYERQLTEACRLVALELGITPDRWALVYQSKSGRPGDPWLEPDILDHVKDLNTRDIKSVVIQPIGFLSDHMEVLYDLDEEARLLCESLGVEMARGRTAGTDPRFVGMLRELIAERIGLLADQGGRAAGDYGPSHHVCPENCCLPAVRPPAPAAARPG
jgi:ferrochelatase